VSARGILHASWLSPVLFAAACASNPPITDGLDAGEARDASTNEVDAGASEPEDAGATDAGVDAGVAPLDAGGTDGGFDAGDDGGFDAGRDAGRDAGPCGECVPGDVDVETRSCGTCGTGMQSRTRTCQASCAWGAFGDFDACTGDGPCCGDGVCDAGETCAGCVDCQAGHLGTGTGGATCAGVPAEQWRCVTSTRWGTRVSQVCCDGAWVNFNLDPRDCAACVCARSDACDAP